MILYIATTVTRLLSAVCMIGELIFVVAICLIFKNLQAKINTL